MATPLGVLQNRFRRSQRQLFIAAAAFSLSCGASSALAQATGPYLDWGTTVGPSAPAGSTFTPAPFLYDGNVASVQAYLQSQQSSGGITAVRINTPISAATASAIFDNSSFTVQYVFADLEGPSNLTQTQTLVGQIQGDGSNKSANAFIGNYSFSTVGSDPTLATARGFSGANINTFRASGANMVNPQLYPGAPDYRDPANGDTTISGGNFPNLRSSLFILPIERLSYAAQSNAAGTPLIPYVSRFMNYGNGALQNGNGTNGGPVGSFVPGVATQNLTATQTTNQMLSRDDFQAQMLHYRLRGATGFHLFDGGVVGYTDTQFQSDATTGFNFLNSSTYGFAATTTTPLTFGSSGNFGGVANKSSEDAGVIVSGVTNSNSKMAILVSNLTDAGTTYQLPSSIANVSVPANELLTVGPDSHDLFEFSVISGQWHLDLSQIVFDDTGLTAQDETGVPEPAAVSMLAIGAIGLLRRRSRRVR
ncbi:MAG TPA: PEP-CTERM sorting domain-containing protein [Tepidisphaeraceae bacterium]|jgi:hypothetical protein|nr:PEP-CTERM sorting domain-containing protein [Tepidisphaeraceae bacterium]